MTNQNTDMHHAKGTVMGGPWQLYHMPVAGICCDDVATAALGALQQVDAQMSTYRADSDVMRVNAGPLGAFLSIPAEMHTVMACADRYARASDGAINVGLGKLVNRWGFGPDAAPDTRPDAQETYAEAARAALGSFALRADPPAVLKHADVALDLCALAKGFAVDKAAQAVRSLGITNFLIEASGEIIGCGCGPDDTPWTVGVELPVPGNDRIVFDEICLNNMAVATTGGHRNRRRIGGHDVSHTINPITGAPLEGDLLSVTVLHAACMDADALATVLYVLGADRGPQFADDNHIAALFLIREPEGLREIRSEAFVATTRR